MITNKEIIQAFEEEKYIYPLCNNELLQRLIGLLREYSNKGQEWTLNTCKDLIRIYEPHNNPSFIRWMNSEYNGLLNANYKWDNEEKVLALKHLDYLLP